MNLYHGTTESQMKRILVQGLRPGGHTNRRYKGSHPNAVYLSDCLSPGYAAYYAFEKSPQLAAVVEVDCALLHPLFVPDDTRVRAECFDETNWTYQEMVALESTITHGATTIQGELLNRKTFRRMEESMSDLHSHMQRLEEDHAIAYMGAIPKNCLSRVCFFVPPLYEQKRETMSDLEITKWFFEGSHKPEEVFVMNLKGYFFRP